MRYKEWKDRVTFDIFGNRATSEESNKVLSEGIAVKIKKVILDWFPSGSASGSVRSWRTLSAVYISRIPSTYSQKVSSSI